MLGDYLINNCLKRIFKKRTKSNDFFQMEDMKIMKDKCCPRCGSRRCFCYSDKEKNEDKNIQEFEFICDDCYLAFCIEINSAEKNNRND